MGVKQDMDLVRRLVASKKRLQSYIKLCEEDLKHINDWEWRSSDKRDKARARLVKHGDLE